MEGMGTGVWAGTEVRVERVERVEARVETRGPCTLLLVRLGRAREDAVLTSSGDRVGGFGKGGMCENAY
jgi:hypothetical protein